MAVHIFMLSNHISYLLIKSNLLKHYQSFVNLYEFTYALLMPGAWKPWYRPL